MGVQTAEAAVLSEGVWGQEEVCLGRRQAGGQLQACSVRPGLVVNRVTEWQRLQLLAAH